MMIRETEGIIPENVTRSLDSTLANLEKTESQLVQFLSHFDIDVLSELPPLLRAQSFFELAKATTTLFSLRVRCDGMHPNDHPVNTELERVRMYEEKLQKFVDLDKAPRRPTATLNQQAASRFIEHSLPDLKPEQKRKLRDNRKKEAQRLNYVERIGKKKRKRNSSDVKYVKDAANDFLEKAAREILGSKHDDPIKGPLRPSSSDDDDAGQ